MITYCENPVKLITILPLKLQPQKGSAKVWTFNLKTGQVLSVAFNQLEEETKGEIHRERFMLALEVIQLKDWMKKNG